MIQVTSLSKSYGGQDLFEDVTFNINSGERVGLVGRNGHGKTTMFRLILGMETADSGAINIPKDYRVGYLQQHLDFTEKTVIAEACLGLAVGHEHDGWRAEKILAGLGFSTKDMQEPPANFSGGFQVRLNLAKVLVSEPDMLLLDEPTNYLDIISIRWLIQFLRNWKTELLLITHDRSFMDSVTTHTLGIHRRRIKKIEGTTGKLYEQIASEEEIYEKTRVNDEKKRKEVELFITRFRAKARLAGMVQSRVKSLEKKQSKHKLQKIETLDFSFKATPFSAKLMMEIDDLSFRYPGMEGDLFSSLNMTVAPDDRICIVGPNGKGKTTLLKAIAGSLQPQTGSIKSHPSLAINYFEQTNTSQLDPNKTVVDELLYTTADCTQQKARDIAGSMMFSGDDAMKKISVLSGGEKSRVMLGKLLLTDCHLLLLDEPTNHLDMESCDSLMAAIDAFDGAVILITHNEMFLHTFATRLIVFDRGKQFFYEGAYGNFLNEIGWESDDEQISKNGNTKPESTSSNNDALDKKMLRKLKAEINQEKSKIVKPLEKRIAGLEANIEKLEAEYTSNNQLLIEASTEGNGQAITDLAKKEHDLQQEIKVSYDELDEVTGKYEMMVEEFEKKLAPIN